MVKKRHGRAKRGTRIAKTAEIKLTQEMKLQRIWDEATQRIRDEIGPLVNVGRRELSIKREALDLLRERMRFLPKLTKSVIRQAHKDAVLLHQMIDDVDAASEHFQKYKAGLFRQRAEARGFVLDEDGHIIGRSSDRSSVTISRAPTGSARKRS